VLGAASAVGRRARMSFSSWPQLVQTWSNSN
jgi:hypothetical protein